MWGDSEKCSVEPMSHSETVLKTVKRRLLLSYPFFGSAVSGLEFKAAEDVERLFASDFVIFYNEGFVGNSTPGEIAYWLCREILHLTMDHGSRRKRRNRIIWGLATEYSVNDILTDAGLAKSVQLRFYNRAYRGKSAEEIYAILVENYRKSGILGKIEETDILRSQNLAKIPEDRIDSVLNHLSRKMKLNGQWLKEILIEEEKRSSEYGLYKPRILEMISKAKLAERTMGKSSFSVDLPIQVDNVSSVPWEELLLDYVLNDRSKVSYRRFNRKYVSQEIFLPQRYHRFNSLVVAVDVSASISEDTLNSFVSDILYLVQTRSADLKMRLMQIDSDIQMDIQIGQSSSPETILRRKGLGGTDFRKLFSKLIFEHNTDPVVLFTDGRGVVPDKPPEGFDVIWVSTDLSMPWGINIEYGVSQ